MEPMTEIFKTILDAAEGEMKIFVIVIGTVALAITFAVRVFKPPAITEDFVKKQQEALDQERAEHQALRQEYAILQKGYYEKCIDCKYRRNSDA